MRGFRPFTGLGLRAPPSDRDKARVREMRCESERVTSKRVASERDEVRVRESHSF